MAKTKSIPTVRMAKPHGRPIQLRYTDQETKREIRISTGTHDEADAAEQKKDLEAKLRLGQDAKPRRRAPGGPTMLWEDFRERYTALHCSTLRPKARVNAESRVDIAERILKPRRLRDLADSGVLHDLQQKLLAGAEGRWLKDKETGERVQDDRPRSPNTVKSIMAGVLAALNWAVFMEWLPACPRVRRVKTARVRQMKGRPITADEFAAMIEATESVVGRAAAPSWRYLLRGLWESGLRLGELLHVHWTDERYIVPAWAKGALPVLRIPATMQKNDTEESIPLLPGFESLLLRTPDDQRTEWAFNPLSLQSRVGRRVRHERSNSDWIGKVISKIGEKASVVVLPATGDVPAKFASAHDLRRSCADRLVAAGVPELEVAAVMRHASVETTRRHYAPGNVQRSAGVIKRCLSLQGGCDARD
jgi:integrase